MLNERRSQLILLAGVVLYAAFYSLICYLKYANFLYYDFDLAVHAQTIWNLGRGSLYSSILGIDFLGNHAIPIFFFLAPLYALLPHPMTILAAQSCALAAAAIPLYYFARSILGYRWALLTAALYLLYPGVGYTNLFEFHPTALATFFLMAMLYFFQQRRFALYAAMALLAMFCQENVPLAVFMMGFYALFQRRPWPWWIFSFVVPSLYFSYAVFFLIPHFNDNTIQFIKIYRHLGPTYPAIIKTMVSHPLRVFSKLLSPWNVGYLTEVMAPLLFVPLAGLGGLLLALPLFMQHLLSSRLAETTTHYHYTAEMIPFIFVAFVWGVRGLFRFVPRLVKRRFSYFLGFSAILTSILLGSLPWIVINRDAYLKDEMDLKYERLLEMVPRDAAVVASFRFLPHLAHRQSLYSYHHFSTGFHTLSSARYRLPDDTSYALVDFGERMLQGSFYAPEGYRRVARLLLGPGWGVRDFYNMAVLFEKNLKTDQKIIDVSRLPFRHAQSLSWEVDPSVRMEGYDVAKDERGVLALSFSWAALSPADKELYMILQLLDTSGAVAYQRIWPLCYGLYPSFAWQPGEHILMRMKFLIPSAIPPGCYTLSMGYVRRDFSGVYDEPGDRWVDLVEVSIH